jgi:two-component sensor histidine kinase/CheY-like chemotaxis protein
MISVLYIDDDEALGHLVRRSLARHGMDVQHAASGVDGVLMLSHRPYDVIALDHMMSAETGLDVIPRLREVVPSTPIIYVTGSDDARVAVAAMKAGAVDYVWKDVEGHYRDLLVQAIETALAHKRMEAEREAATRALIVAKERAEVLLAEVNHRVANSLALVASMATLQAKVATEPATRHALQQMRSRIVAVSGIHRRLYTSADVRTVSLGSYLHGLAEELSGLLSDGTVPRAICVTADESVSLSTDRAVSLAVVVTELVTNALKYAYRDDEPGEIRIGLERRQETAVLSVEDDGVGYAGGDQAQGTGLGSKIVQAMARSADATLCYEPIAKGTRVVLVLALTDCLADRL